MNVQLLSHTPQPDKLAATAARLCYSAQGAGEIMATIKDDKIRKRIGECVDKGHHSVLEHAVFTFSIDGISRVTSHQLVRHRVASYSQQSQRYVKLNESDSYVIPPRIRDNEALRSRFEENLKTSQCLYNEMIEAGIPPEDARYILPSAMGTRILVTMNARELLHFFNLRCCKKAQWEIRKLAYSMLRLAAKAAPLIFEKAGPACMEGSCPQKDQKCFERMSRIRR